jgi:DNA polymerase III subunit delta'
MSLNTAIYPWQHTLYQHLNHALHHQRLPHALLFCGPPGMGKAHLAQQFAHLLLCSSATTFPCGTCKTCLLLKAGNHPDLKIIEAEAPGKQIKIDTIRELANFCALTSNYGRWQVIIINPAEAMNQNAANSLLKLLEEPPLATILMLISHHPARLLPTIRSRCQRFDFGHDPQDILAGREWLHAQLSKKKQDIDLLLQLSHQAPLAALALVEKLPQRHALIESLYGLIQGRRDPLQTASEWVNLGTVDCLMWLLSWTQDLARCIGGGNALNNRDHAPRLMQLAQRLDLHRLFKVWEQQQTILRLVRSTANIREQGMMEEVALAWHALGTHSGAS